MKILTHLLMLLFVLFTGQIGLSQIIYVDQDATGANNGTSWTNAYTTLTTAIENASAGEKIWIADGVYYPQTDESGDSAPIDNRTKTFLLKDQVKVFGGFDGSETDEDQRDLNTNFTTLSGDIGIFGDTTDNCYHVVTAVNVAKGTVIDGVRIRKGNCADIGESGAGLFIDDSQITIRNVRLSDNDAITGSAIYSYDSRCRINRCLIFQNSGTNAYLSGFFSVDTIVNSIVAFNSGSGVSVDDSLTMIQCTVYGNGNHGVYKGQFGATKIFNSLLWANQGYQFRGYFTQVTSDYDIQNCFIENGLDIWDNGSLNYLDDPRFVDPENYNFEVLSCSPIINAGSNSFNAIIGTADFNQNPRVVNDTVDAGALEFQSAATDLISKKLYVDGTASGLDNGTSWMNAFKELSNAVELNSKPEGCDTYIEIRVAEGVYHPSTSDRDSSFVIDRNVKLLGGFPSGGGTLMSRNWVANPTILSGEIGDPTLQSDNSKRLLFCYQVDTSTIIDGFVLQDVYTEDFVGVAKFEEGSPRFQNARIENCIEGASTQSILRIQDDGVTLTNITFDQCEAANLIYTNTDLTTEFYDCTFKNNVVGELIDGLNARAKLLRSRIFNNQISETLIDAYILEIDNCLITDYGTNVLPFTLIDAGLSLEIKGTTIYSDASTLIEMGGVSTCVIENSIFDGRYEDEVYQTLPDIEYIVKNSIVRNQYSNEVGKVFGPPRFVDPTTGDYRLRECSPAINSGDASLYPQQMTDLDQEPREVGQLDLGPYEFQGSYEAPTKATLYVDSMASGTGSGINWMNAYPELADAIVFHYSGMHCKDVDSILVAKGTYLPPSSGEFDGTFVMRSDVVMLGGYANGGSSLADRNPELNETILSGDTGVPNDSTDNSIQILRTLSMSNESRIDGFVIEKAGNTTEPGTAWYGENCELIFAHNVLRNNRSDISNSSAGEVVALSNANPEIEHCAFYNNAGQTILSWESADTFQIRQSIFENNMTYSGGALTLFGNAVVEECEFKGNTARIGGGAILSSGPSDGLLRIDQCQFLENAVTENLLGGGAILGSHPVLIDRCFFIGNEAGSRGGGAVELLALASEIRNSVFADNHAAEGGAINIKPFFVEGNYEINGNTFYDNSGGLSDHINSTSDSLKIVNNIFDGSDDPILTEGADEVFFDYNHFAVGTINPNFTTGANNIVGVIPEFSDPTDFDGEDNVYGTPDDGLQLSLNSLSINAGNNFFVDTSTLFDVAGRQRILFNNVDIGAYEFLCGDAPINVYINQNATFDGSGVSWNQAATHLPSGIQKIIDDGCLIDSIFLATGTYFASEENNRNQSITLPSGSTMIGGFDIQNNAMIDWSPLSYPTIISGNLGQPTINDNTYRLITIEDLSDTITIIGIQLESAVDSVGSALYIPSVIGNAPLVLKDVIVKNHKSPFPVMTREKLDISFSHFLNNRNQFGTGRGILNDGGQVRLEQTNFDGISQSQPLYILNRNGGIIRLKGSNDFRIDD